MPHTLLFSATAPPFYYGLRGLLAVEGLLETTAGRQPGAASARRRSQLGEVGLDDRDDDDDGAPDTRDGAV